MAITKNDIVTYGDLKNYILQKIKQNCCNIDRLPTLPADIDPNNKKRKITIGSGDKKQTVIISSTDISGIVKQVSSNEVWNQLSSFLQSRGLLNKPNIPISSKAMLNLFNNIAIFLSCRQKVCSSSVAQKTTGQSVYVFYDSSSEISYDTAPYVFDTDSLPKTGSTGSISKQEAIDSIKSMITQINRTSNIVAVEMSIRCVCSSSSSSCSSSSSSSSCSSSSSSFIVYMLI